MPMHQPGPDDLLCTVARAYLTGYVCHPPRQALPSAPKRLGEPEPPVYLEIMVARVWLSRRQGRTVSAETVTIELPAGSGLAAWATDHLDRMDLVRVDGTIRTRFADRRPAGWLVTADHRTDLARLRTAAEVKADYAARGEDLPLLLQDLEEAGRRRDKVELDRHRQAIAAGRAGGAA